jgi:CheY-like chemotaxis protein
LGKGSRFIVSLPWIVASKAAVAKKRVVEIVGEGQKVQTGTAPLPSPHSNSANLSNSPIIMLAEDNENLIEIYADYIQTNNYRVVVARDGLEALSVADEEEPDLMLIDVQMPKMDGLEVMKKLRTEGRFADVPIIALTANVLPAYKKRCLEAGATDFLGKPSSMAQIMAMIKKYI